MEETLVLILLVLVMLVGSYLAGSIPLVINFSEVCISLSLLTTSIFIVPPKNRIKGCHIFWRRLRLMRANIKFYYSLYLNPILVFANFLVRIS